MAEKARREGFRVLRPDLETKPRVRYGGFKRWKSCFIGGSISATVSGAVECVADAAVVLYAGDQRVAGTLSDAFGDFRFGGLEKNSGMYRIEIRHARGNATRECAVGESVYLGEVSLALAASEVEAN
ncbi:hypothetical protein QFZ91_000675 [Paraburkholderia sp. JPY419]